LISGVLKEFSFLTHLVSDNFIHKLNAILTVYYKWHLYAWPSHVLCCIWGW